jgi:glycosyltransferase involved in cell wall biosynthesis
VSVVIPAYNAERWVGGAIESALGQVGVNTEVIVVDDGSSDGTVAVARQYASDRVRVITDGVNRGAPVARNHGLSVASGTFVKFLDADDLLIAGTLVREVAAAMTLAHMDDVIVFADATFGETRRHIRTVEDQAPEAFSMDLGERVTYFVECSIQTACPLHRPELLARVGGFRADLKRAQEYDLHLRLAVAGVRFQRVPHVGVWVRTHHSPTRIAIAQYGARQREEADAGFRNWLGWRELVTRAVGEPVPRRITRRFAREAWLATRHLVQMDRLDLARRYAREAIALDPGMAAIDGRGFRVLARGLGPVRAEQLLGRARRWRRGRGWRRIAGSVMTELWWAVEGHRGDRPPDRGRATPCGESEAGGVSRPR